MIKKIFTLAIVTIGCISNAEARKVYFEPEEIDLCQDVYHAHMGGNRWLSSNQIFEEDGKLFIYSDSFHTEFNLDTMQCEYVNRWCCPYCHYYWNEHCPCENPDCPRLNEKKKKQLDKMKKEKEKAPQRHPAQDNRNYVNPTRVTLPPIRIPTVRC